jgi:4-aminobutyrate aminotransferase / (S)-3-amino-2-methylpropionate transaminase / 5-aminovalerate transaminase
VEIVKSKKSKERGVRESQAITSACFKDGLILITAGRNTLRVVPPLNVAREELEEGLDVMEAAIAKVNSG